MIWTEELSVPTYLSNRYNKLSINGLARLFQEVAEHHTSRTAIGYKDLQQEKKAWVLNQMYYEFYRMPEVAETIQLQTWSRGCNGLYALRDYAMIGPDGEKLAAATSRWVVIDFEKRHVCRIDHLMDHYEHHEQQSVEHEFPRLRTTAEMNTVDRLVVRESSIDRVHHVNNAEYIKWIIDYEGASFNPSQLEICYHQEIHVDAPVEIQLGVDQEFRYYQISSSNTLAAVVCVK